MLTPLGLFIAGTLVLIQWVEWVAEWLNVSALKKDPPPGFEDVYDGKKYARAQDYTRAKTRFGFVDSSLKLAGLLAFWFLGGFGFMDRFAGSFGFSEIPTGVIYLGVLFFLNELFSLPFSIYSTFVLEARFDFNKTTPRTFVLDRLKGLLLTAAIGGPLLALLLWFFGRLGSTAWLWAWGAVTGFTLLLQFVAPSWILPLFNKFTPLPEGDLRRAIFDYAQRVGYPLSNLFVMDGSKRSAKGNAFFTGFGKNKRIALFDTLVEKYSVDELVAVLAHEIGHHKKGHVWKGFALSALQTGGTLFVLSLALRWPALFGAFQVDPSVHAGFAVFGILFSPVGFILSLPLHAFSRRNEFEADRYAAETLGTGRALASGLRKLSAESLANLTPHPFYVWLHATHPPLVERVRALQ
ncbi:MAG: M48 family metallopeptidase [Elusimicrobia bacterium]|nr:M48 family metallopeptidase [Elusimicrobiota bacterium]